MPKNLICSPGPWASDPSIHHYQPDIPHTHPEQHQPPGIPDLLPSHSTWTFPSSLTFQTSSCSGQKPGSCPWLPSFSGPRAASDPFQPQWCLHSSAQTAPPHSHLTRVQGLSHPGPIFSLTSPPPGSSHSPCPCHPTSLRFLEPNRHAHPSAFKVAILLYGMLFPSSGHRHTAPSLASTSPFFRDTVSTPSLSCFSLPQSTYPILLLHTLYIGTSLHISPLAYKHQGQGGFSLFLTEVLQVGPKWILVKRTMKDT